MFGISINLILMFVLISNMIMDTLKMRSNCKLRKEYEKNNRQLNLARKSIEEDISVKTKHMDEHRKLNYRLGSVNRKLTILNKANYKKY